LPQSAEDVPNLVEAPTITPPKFGFCWMIVDNFYTEILTL
jgi:hypothetical protein